MINPPAEVSWQTGFRSCFTGSLNVRDIDSIQSGVIFVVANWPSGIDCVEEDPTENREQYWCRNCDLSSVSRQDVLRAPGMVS